MSAIIPYTNGKFPTYRFYVASVPYSNALEVFPLNFLETLLSYELEGDNIFYRCKFTGTLLFGTNSQTIDVFGATVNRRDDWLYFWDIEQNTPCVKIYFVITKTVEGVTTTYWNGYFSTSDGKFDIDNCTFEVTPILQDDYNDILAGAELEYNILSVTPVVTTTAFVAGVINNVYTRNRWLVDVIEYIADKLITGVNISSTFFTNTDNPVTSPAPLTYGNHLRYLTIAQKSDIIRPASSDSATSAMLSWSKLMDILWAMFQVKWDYDGVNTINIEHISWWTKGIGIDLRLQPACIATNKYSYLKEKMPKYEKYTFMEADEVNFVGVPIWYDSLCINDDPETNIIETSIEVTTDVEYINNSPDAISDDGFVILCNYLDGADYYVELQKGILNDNVKLNNHLSWANLQHYYFRDHRVLIEGYMNNVLTTFWTAQKTKQQTCSAIICVEFDPLEEIITELGENYFLGAKATVKLANMSPSGETDLVLLYGPADNENTGVEDNDEKIINIVQDPDNCVTFYATLTVTSGIILAIKIREIICNADTSVLCTGVWEDWNIPIGVHSDTINTSMCDTIPAGGYVIYELDTTAIPLWTVNFTYNTHCAGA